VVKAGACQQCGLAYSRAVDIASMRHPAFPGPRIVRPDEGPETKSQAVVNRTQYQYARTYAAGHSDRRS